MDRDSRNDSMHKGAARIYKEALAKRSYIQRGKKHTHSGDTDHLAKVSNANLHTWQSAVPI